MPSTDRRIHWPSLIRQAHLYLGMLIAPSILMFAFSGAIQIFRLHEAHGDYHPPALIERLGRLHKDQVFQTSPPRAARPATTARPTMAATADDHDEDHERASASSARTQGAATPARPGPTLSKRLLQWFFTLVAIGLIVSTLLGIWMGAMQSRWKVTARWMLLAGVVVPVALLFV